MGKRGVTFPADVGAADEILTVVAPDEDGRCVAATRATGDSGSDGHDVYIV